ncbi:MAG: septum formation initiator family protein [Polyangiaceae bacterium]|nr:septum formation initiator family protein [Polyangiaceae bacterium]
MLGRMLPVILLCVALVGAPFMIFSSEGLPRLRTLEKELAAVEQENAMLRRQADVTRARVAKLRDDPAAIERLARDELGLVRHSEIVFNFPK